MIKLEERRRRKEPQLTHSSQARQRNFKSGKYATNQKKNLRLTNGWEVTSDYCCKESLANLSKRNPENFKVNSFNPINLSLPYNYG